MGQKSNSWHYYGWRVRAAALFTDSQLDLMCRLSQSPVSPARTEMRSRGTGQDEKEEGALMLFIPFSKLGIEVGSGFKETRFPAKEKKKVFISDHIMVLSGVCAETVDPYPVYFQYLVTPWACHLMRN